MLLFLAQLLPENCCSTLVFFFYSVENSTSVIVGLKGAQSPPFQKYWNSKANLFVFALHWRHLYGCFDTKHFMFYVAIFRSRTQMSSVQMLIIWPFCSNTFGGGCINKCVFVNSLINITNSFQDTLAHRFKKQNSKLMFVSQYFIGKL